VVVNTYIDLSENINESTVVIGWPAESLEHTEPFRAQSIATGSQLGTQTWNVIQPTRYNVKWFSVHCNCNYGIYNAPPAI